ncbi:MAG: PAS domain S-box protein [Spirochaetia bacterium]
MRKKQAPSSKDKGRYKSIFQHSAVSLWEEDISAVRSMIKDLRDRGITNLREYLDTHVEVVREAVRSIKVIDVNDATLSLYEAESKEQLLGSLEVFIDVDVDPVARASFTETICAIDEGRKDIQTESAARTLLGKPLTLIVKSYIPEEDDAYPYMLVSLIDITQLKNTESKLLMERSLLNALMESLPDHIYFKDTKSRFIRISKALAEMFSLQDGSEAIGKTDRDFFSDEHAHKAYEDEQGIMRTGHPFIHIEEKETWPDRPDTWVLTTKMPLRDQNGKVLGTFGISRDITERKRMEERNRQLAALVESSDDAIVEIALDGSIASWNKGAERIYGYSADEIIGKSTAILTPPELEEKSRLMQERLAKGGRIDHFETILMRKDGARIDVSLTFSFIRNAEGRATGIASIARDITAQKAIQAQLQRAQRLEGLATLASGIAHQFNNINAVVKGYLDMIQQEANLPERLSAYAKGAAKGIEKAVDITDRLLALTAPTAAEPKPVRLEILTRLLLSLLEPRFIAEKVALVLELEETPLVQADESRLLFVISSLLVNALDALAEQSLRKITIRNGRRPDAVFLEVNDTGCGIPAENLPRLFTPFFTSKGEWASTGSPQAKLRGVGLSLSVSNATITEYGGRLEVQSTPGNGSTFRLLMPFIKENG